MRLTGEGVSRRWRRTNAGLARGLRRGIASRTKAEHNLDHDGSPKNIHVRSVIRGTGYA